MRKLPSLVMIEWEDSAQAAPQWQWLSDFSAPAMARCLSVGFLVKDTEEEKSLAISLANAGDIDSAQIAGIITIPARCITRIERLTSSFLPLAYGREPALAQMPQAS